MRRWSSSIAIALAIPVLLGFQVVSGPLMFCGFGTCKMVVCDIDVATSEMICEMVPVASMDCCAMMAPTESEVIGCCGEAEAVVIAICKTLPAAEPTSCGGCASDDIVEVAICGMQESSTAVCETEPLDPADCELPCAECMPARDAQPPVRFTSVPVDDGETRRSYTFPAPAESATYALIESDFFSALVHSHSPPHAPPVSTGYAICLNKCSFRL